MQDAAAYWPLVGTEAPLESGMQAPTLLGCQQLVLRISNIENPVSSIEYQE